MSELNTIINEQLFKSTTDGASGTKELVNTGGVLSWETKTQPAYVGLLSASSETFTMVANTAQDLTSASLWATTASKNIGVTLTTGEVTITNAGVYTIASWLSASSSAVNTTITTRYAINGVSSTTALVSTSKDAGDTNNLSASSIIALAVGDVLKLTIETDTDATLTVEDCGLSLHKIDEV